MKTHGGERLLQKLRNEFGDQDVDWNEFVQWACNYDVQRELRAWCFGEEFTEDDIEKDEEEILS
jgi:hypothetical protein